MLWNSYLLLAIGIVFEVAGTMLLPISQNFTKPIPTIALALFYMASFYCLTFSLREIPISIVYATWSGIGIFLITIFGYFIYRQSVNWQTILGLALIISGVILVNSYSALHSGKSL
jgi:small multidrug resistance pump